MTAGTRRWPLHPPPAPGEALTSWIWRLAALYGMRPRELLRAALGKDQALLAQPEAADLDYDPPPGILQALASQTGTDLAAVRRTTIAGWMPWLCTSLEPGGGQEAFDDYVRADPVLLAPGEAGRSIVPRWLPWMPARDRPRRARTRASCPECFTDPARGRSSALAVLPLVTTCGEHGRRFQSESDVRLSLIAPSVSGRPLPLPEPVPPVPEAVIALDRLTWEGIATGMVTLPVRAVHVGVWFRLLRTLLDEVSTAPGKVGDKSAATLAAIWEAAGRPARGGLGTWRTYERLGPGLQEAMMHAAAVALQMAAAGEITAQGVLGRCLADGPHREVYEGDRAAWEQKQARAREDAEIQAMLDRARYDPVTARKVLAWLTFGIQDPGRLHRERQYLISTLRIPEEFLQDRRDAQAPPDTE